MRDKGGTMLISTRATGGNIELRFRDSGEGMSPETVARIFDPFYTTKESGKGTGLGLAIVAQIVETHGGRIYVDSQLGEGTEFRILLPVCVSADTTDLTKTIAIRQDEYGSRY
jgi:signal transduction histidine kinase